MSGFVRTSPIVAPLSGVERSGTGMRGQWVGGERRLATGCRHRREVPADIFLLRKTGAAREPRLRRPDRESGRGSLSFAEWRVTACHKLAPGALRRKARSSALLEVLGRNRQVSSRCAHPDLRSHHVTLSDQNATVIENRRGLQTEAIADVSDLGSRIEVELDRRGHMALYRALPGDEADEVSWFAHERLHVPNHRVDVQVAAMIEGNH